MQTLQEVRELATSFEELTGINAQDEKEVLSQQLTEVWESLLCKADTISTLPKIIKRNTKLKPTAGYEEEMRRLSGILNSIAEKVDEAQELWAASACADENGETLPLSDEEKAETEALRDEITEVCAILQRTIAVAEIFSFSELNKAFAERTRREESPLK